jgi:hypothetical protein
LLEFVLELDEVCLSALAIRGVRFERFDEPPALRRRFVAEVEQQRLEMSTARASLLPMTRPHSKHPAPSAQHRAMNSRH